MNVYKITFQQVYFPKVGIIKILLNQIYLARKEILNEIDASSSRWWVPFVLSEQKSEHGSVAGRMQSDGGIGSGADDWFYWLEN